jgi:hypothetical protein
MKNEIKYLKTASPLRSLQARPMLSATWSRPWGWAWPRSEISPRSCRVYHDCSVLTCAPEDVSTADGLTDAADSAA